MIITSYFCVFQVWASAFAAAKRDLLSFPRSIVDRCTAGCSHRRAFVGGICSANASVAGVSICYDINIWVCVNMMCR